MDDFNPNLLEKEQKFVIFYYVVTSFVALSHLTCLSHLFTKLANNKDFLTLKAIKFSLYQLLIFNLIGIYECYTNINVTFRLIVSAFQMLTFSLICVLMILAFGEVRRSRAYEEMYGEGTSLSSEHYFTKVRVAFVIYGMIYSGIMVINLAIMTKLYQNFIEIRRMANESTTSNAVDAANVIVDMSEKFYGSF